MYKKQIEIRLIGVRVDHLQSKEEQQLSFFESKENEKQEKLDKTIDELKQKYGYNVITRAGKMKIGKMLKLKDIE